MSYLSKNDNIRFDTFNKHRPTDHVLGDQPIDKNN